MRHTPKQICKRLEKLNISVKFVDEKCNSCWVVGYISVSTALHPNLSLGKICFKNGKFSHFKWYGAGYNQYIHYAAEWLIEYNVIVKPRFFELILLNAQIKAEADFDKKVQNRGKLNVKKRKPLAPPNACRYIEFPEQYKHRG